MLFERICILTSWDIESVDVEALAQAIQCQRYRFESLESLENRSGSIISITTDHSTAARICNKYSKSSQFVHLGQVVSVRAKRYIKVPGPPPPPLKVKTDCTRDITPPQPISEAGKAALKRLEPTIQVPVAKTKRHERRLPKGYISKLVDSFGEHIVILQEVFQRYCTEERLSIRGLAMALESLRRPDEIDPDRRIRIAILQNTKDLIQQLIRNEKIGSERMPSSIHDAFLAFSDFLSVCAHVDLNVEEDLEITEESTEEITEETTKETTEEIEIRPVEKEIVQYPETKEMTELRRNFAEFDMYGHEGCSEVALSDLPVILEKTLPNCPVSLQVIRDCLYRHEAISPRHESSNLWRIGSATFNDAVTVMHHLLEGEIKST